MEAGAHTFSQGRKIRGFGRFHSITICVFVDWWQRQQLGGRGTLGAGLSAPKLASQWLWARPEATMLKCKGLEEYQVSIRA